MAGGSGKGLSNPKLDNSLKESKAGGWAWSGRRTGCWARAVVWQSQEGEPGEGEAGTDAPGTSRRTQAGPRKTNRNAQEGKSETGELVRVEEISFLCRCRS